MATVTYDLERATNVLRESYAKINAEKKAKSIIFLKEVPKASRMPQPVSKHTCQALTLTGKPCAFKATSPCGKFCKKHIIVE